MVLPVFETGIEKYDGHIGELLQFYMDVGRRAMGRSLYGRFSRVFASSRALLPFGWEA